MLVLRSRPFSDSGIEFSWYHGGMQVLRSRVFSVADERCWEGISLESIGEVEVGCRFQPTVGSKAVLRSGPFVFAQPRLWRSALRQGVLWFRGAHER
jgi:hypothetical protein